MLVPLGEEGGSSGATDLKKYRVGGCPVSCSSVFLQRPLLGGCCPVFPARGTQQKASRKWGSEWQVVSSIVPQMGKRLMSPLQRPLLKNLLLFS